MNKKPQSPEQSLAEIFISRAIFHVETRLIAFLLMTIILVFFISCTSSKQTAGPTEEEGMRHVTMDTMEILSETTEEEELVEYQPSEERKWDLLHTMLDLTFDWKKEAVHGKATLTLTPYFYPQSDVRIDAIDFEVSTITIRDSLIRNYHNTGSQIIIPLSKPLKKGDQLEVVISYTAYPRASGVNLETMGITDDKGLFFIDPQDTIADLPQQIWSQGETTYNSKWFPTLDQPNERCTQEVILTVDSKFQTLSNGLMITSTPLPGGMRRDHWKLDLPHAPYLTMIAVGQWDRATDYWRGRPVDYYVHPGYGPSARSIFSNTTEMMEFFSNRFGYDFVWPKYAQVVVKQFVSGAMENTTAVIFGDFIEFDIEDVISPGPNDYIVAHELCHHWFGDLVTCESWANLTLNEGFANYSEYLWNEHKYGRERADLARMEELSGYFDQASMEVFPLIRYHYKDASVLFDAHSYNKGSLILHMLRNLVGEEAFFTSIRDYLTEHAFQSTEVDDLRMAFEKVTGKDLHWFFDQWYFEPGHPVLEIQHSFDRTQNKLKIEIEQTQQTRGYNDLYILPIEIGLIMPDKTIQSQHIWLNQQSQTFNFGLADEPLAVVVDPRDILLAEIDHTIPSTEYEVRTLSNLSINHRLSAFRLLEDPEEELYQKLLHDSSAAMRAMAISRLAEQEDFEALYKAGMKETDLETRYFILQVLNEAEYRGSDSLAIALLESSDHPLVIYEGLNTLRVSDPDEAFHRAAHCKDHSSSAVQAAVARIYATRDDMVNLDYFTTPKGATIRDEYLEDWISAMAMYMSRQPGEIQDKGLAIIDSDFFLKTPEPEYRRIYLITGLVNQLNEEISDDYLDKILDTIQSIYEKEPDVEIKELLKEGLGELLD